MEPGVDDHPVVLANLQTVLGAGGLYLVGLDLMPDVTHLGGVAGGGVPLFLELVAQVAHIHNDAGADAALQVNLRESVAVGLPVYLLLMEDVVGGVHVGAGVKGAGVGHGAFMEAAQVLAAGENQVLAGAGKGPQGGVHSPGHGQVIDLGHFGVVQIELGLVKGHISHGKIPPDKK